MFYICSIMSSAADLSSLSYTENLETSLFSTSHVLNVTVADSSSNIVSTVCEVGIKMCVFKNWISHVT